MAMRNADLIFSRMCQFPVDFLHEKALLATTERALNAWIAVCMEDGMTPEEAAKGTYAVFAAEVCHTFNRRKEEGRSVKAGEKAAFCLDIWKATRKKAKEDGAEDTVKPYLRKAWFFWLDQTEAAPKGKTAEEIKAQNRASIAAYNAMRKAQRGEVTA